MRDFTVSMCDKCVLVSVALGSYVAVRLVGWCLTALSAQKSSIVPCEN